MKMARRYVRDAEGRFAPTSGGGYSPRQIAVEIHGVRQRQPNYDYINDLKHLSPRDKTEVSDHLSRLSTAGNPSASYSGFSTGHKAEPLRTDNRAAKVEEARLLAAAQARRAARNAAPTPPSSVEEWARNFEIHGFSPVEAAKLAKKKVATDNPVSDDAKIAARKAAKAERARKRRAAAKGN